MLDNITKRRINDCRDILVGKLPDPKSQIEQITIALIYKFMDDMDKEAIELGGKAKFFSDYNIPDPNDPKKEIVVPFEKYSWDNLFDTKVSATEMLKLYSEAIEGMVKNPNIPELFSNIFKNAYLPYRDPETLKMFLKTISEFEYTHSEKLGDAFEYLLSVMGSQGDAGQFRTPRHIIDFLVAAVDPNKNDTILDPACGTAGFLISAFKHIKEQNNNKLTPDEQKRLIKNFVGYDISPDMVRLSLVNLYLHGFSDPHIHEYDSLSSEDRWNETFDVVLANPPFMSPKGGIKPHKRFSVQANKSEVLFVDYILEHLNKNGKAGIIVPEGIIFQTGKAYTSLRKTMIKNNLSVVISLPVGVFNPYTKTTKTSILIFDSKIQKKTNGIYFIKIENDGFELGSERKPISKNDLPEALRIINIIKNQQSFTNKKIETDLLTEFITIDELNKRLHNNLAVLNDVEEVNNEYDNIEIRKILNPKKKSIKLDDEKIYKQITVKMNGKGVVLRKEIKGNDVKTKSQFIATNGDFIMSKIDARNGAFGIVPEELNNGIVTQDFPLFNVNSSVMLPDFLNIVIQSPQFIKICQTTSIGTSNRRRINIDKFLNSRIPLPNINEQKIFLEKINNLNEKIEKLESEITKFKTEFNIEVQKVWIDKQNKNYIKLSNDLYLAMMLKQMEKKIQLNYGEVATQKTVFHLNTFTNQKLDYPFMNSNFGTYSYQLKEDLVKNPYLSKTKKGSGEVFVVTSSKENEVLEALSNPENKEFVEAINEVLKIYQTPLINKETENIELLNTVSKVILDKQSTDLDIVYAGMQEWKIEQNGFTTKADKFTKTKTKRMIDLIEKLGLVGKLIKE